MSSVIKPSKRLPGANTSPVRSGQPCSGRSVKKFSAFAKLLASDPSKINNMIASALLGEEILDQYVGPTGIIGSECVFSYPDSDWYSVPVVDEEGGLQYDESTGSVIKMYFKIKMKGEKDAEMIQDSLTNDTPDELFDSNRKEINNCVISGSTCKNPEGISKQKTEVSTRKGKESPSPVQVSPTILAQLQSLSLGPSEAGPSSKPKASGKMTREFFEQMNSKTLIVNWMIEHMERADLVKCIQRGALSAADVKAAEDLSEMEVPGESDNELAEITKQMPEKEVFSTLKKISKESIRVFEDNYGSWFEIEPEKCIITIEEFYNG